LAKSDKSGDDKKEKDDKFSGDSEGVPGYLVKPVQNILLEQKLLEPAVRSVKITARPGSVANPRGKVGDVWIGLFAIKAADFYAPLQSGSDQYLSPKLLEALHPDDSGGFERHLKLDQASVLIIAVVKNADANTIVLKAANSDHPREVFVDYAKSPELQILSADALQAPAGDPTCKAGPGSVEFIIGKPGASCTEACASSLNGETAVDVPTTHAAWANANVCLSMLTAFCTNVKKFIMVDQGELRPNLGCHLRPHTETGAAAVITANDIPTANGKHPHFIRLCACKAP